MVEPILRQNRNIGGKLNMTVYGGLNFIRGNKKPYFSITAEIKEGRREYAGGCCHDEILRVYPELSDVIKMHLSDIDGEPLYSVENGYFWLTAVQGTNQYEKDTGKDYVNIFSEYVRISREEARALSDRIKDKGEFSEWVESQKPRWKNEAETCIKKHHLIVFGDYYKEA
jgi:hypothetical protein